MYPELVPVIQRILDKLAALKSMDSAFTIFGSNRHKYNLDAPRNLDEVTSFEQKWNITLPDEYKAFLLLAGSGGAGPYYGLEQLEDGVYTDFYHAEKLNHISRAFPYTEAWNDLGDDEDYAEWEKAYYSPDKSAGLLGISDFGCGVSMKLVVNGLSYGEIWVDDRSSDQGIYPDHYFGNKERLTFLAWYEMWLDQSIEKMKSK